MKKTTFVTYKLTDHQRWLFNFLRKQGYTVVVIDPDQIPICGRRADLQVIDDVFAEETPT